MEQLFFDEEDLMVMVNLSEYLFKKKPKIFFPDGNGNNETSGGEDFTPITKLAPVTGYSKKTIYNVVRDKRMSEKKWKTFKSKFEVFEQSKNLNDVDRINLEVFRKLKAKLDGKLSGEVLDENSKTLAQFENKKWYIYERFDHFIGRKLLEFGMLTDEKIGVTIHTAHDQIGPWKGHCFTDSTKSFLVIHSTHTNEINALPTNYLIRIDRYNVGIELCIGQVTFIVKAKNSVETNNIILEKLSDNDMGSAKFIMLDELEKSEVKPQIITYLMNGKLTKLGTPHMKIITSFKDFDFWHERVNDAKRENRNENIIGDYTVYYRSEVFDAALKIDTLSIYENKHCDIEASYMHKIEKNNQKEWLGDLFYSPNAREIFIALKGPVKNSFQINSSMIYLVLNIPAGDKKFDVLTGMIAGVLNIYDRPISSLVVIVRKDDLRTTPNIYDPVLDKKSDIERVQEFFDAYIYRCVAIPPVLPVSSFESLNEVVSEGLETKKKIIQVIKK